MVSEAQLEPCELQGEADNLLFCRATQFAITKALPYIFSSFGFGTWYFFAAWMLIGTAWAFFLLPETKGLTIDQMDLILYVLLQSPFNKIYTDPSQRL
jgi:hypothetical protein